MFKEYRHQRNFRKVTLKKPLYKPVKVRHKGMDIDFNESLIDACYLIHKSMIGILDIQYKETSVKLKMDYLVNESVDYLSAFLLHTYFTQWVNDVKEMHEMTDGGE